MNSAELFDKLTHCTNNMSCDTSRWLGQSAAKGHRAVLELRFCQEPSDSFQLMNRFALFDHCQHIGSCTSVHRYRINVLRVRLGSDSGLILFQHGAMLRVFISTSVRNVDSVFLLAFTFLDFRIRVVPELTALLIGDAFVRQHRLPIEFAVQRNCPANGLFLPLFVVYHEVSCQLDVLYS